MQNEQRLDAVLLIAYGGPNAPEETRPFLDVVLKGRSVPRERVEEVAHHYEVIGGISPLTRLTREQGQALEQQLAARGAPLRVYVGMRNWHPFLVDTIREMAADGVRRGVGVIMAAYRSDTSWERYQRDVAEACAQAGNAAPRFEYVEPYYNQEGFLAAVTEQVQQAFETLGSENRRAVPLVFTAHSIPTAMADESPYVEQLTATCRRVAERLEHLNWQLAYQSRSGSPHTPWLEPDILDVLRRLAEQGTTEVVIEPIGFLCDHVEVLYDLDIETQRHCDDLGITMVRAATVGVHPKFIAALADLVVSKCAH
jgi:ferrochelatase